MVNLKIPMRKIVLSLVVSLLILLPTILAYPATLPAYDLFGVFVEAVFGGFWLSVIGLAAIMFILLAPIGGLSQWTAMTYCMFFVFAMAIGYTHPLIVIPFWTAIVGWSVFQMFKFINSASAA